MFFWIDETALNEAEEAEGRIGWRNDGNSTSMICHPSYQTVQRNVTGSLSMRVRLFLYILKGAKCRTDY